MTVQTLVRVTAASSDRPWGASRSSESRDEDECTPGDGKNASNARIDRTYTHLVNSDIHERIIQLLPV